MINRSVQKISENCMWPAVQNPKIFNLEQDKTEKSSEISHFTVWNLHAFAINER